MSKRKNPSNTPESLATERRKEGHGIADLNKRLARYSNAKKRSSAMGDYIMAKSESDRNLTGGLTPVKMAVMSERIRKCGSYLRFRYYPVSDRARLSEAYFCRYSLLCPFCAIRRASKYLGEYLKRFEQIMQENPNLIPTFVTLTTKDGKDCQERFKHLKRGHNLMRKRGHDYERGKGSYIEFNKVKGSVTAFETVIGQNSKEWHCHSHSIWLVEKPIDKFKLSKEWQSITGDSFIVDVQLFKGNPLEDFKEIFKYQLKFSTLSYEDNWTAYTALKGKRMLETTGLFRGIEIDDSLTDELIENEEYIELFFNYLHSVGQYNLIRKERHGN